MRYRSAFTLIELLVVIAIIALLVSILLPSLQQAKEMAKSVTCTINMRNLTSSSYMYAQEYGAYPRANYVERDAGGTVIDAQWIGHLSPFMQGIDQADYTANSGWAVPGGDEYYLCPSVDVDPGGPATIQIGMSQYFDRAQWQWTTGYTGLGWNTAPLAYKGFLPEEVKRPSETIMFGDKPVLPFGSTQPWSPIVSYSRSAQAYWPDCRHLDKVAIGFPDTHAGTLNFDESLESERYQFLLDD